MARTRLDGDSLALTGSLPAGNIKLETGAGYGGLNTVAAVPIIFYNNDSEKMRLDINGNLQVGVSSGNSHFINKPGTVEGGIVLVIQGGGNSMAYFQDVRGGGANAASSGLFIGKHSISGRSINAGGTINASGADYAEYMTKAPGCDTIAKGQIVGVDADGLLVDCWSDAVSFLIKSTDPSYVGGDMWGSEERLGIARPPAPDDDAQAMFEQALEQARQRVDRIAFCGQVPCNVLGARPGQYVVPVQHGDGIGGQLVDPGEITFAQYRRAVGIVQNVLPDGRANVRVKVV
jgi:hypothetical protein